MDKFIISLRLGTQLINFNIVQIYTSEQVLRFRVTWKGYEMEIEKRLLNKSNKWRVLKTSFQITKPNAAENLNSIFNVIDARLNPRGEYHDPKSGQTEAIQRRSAEEKRMKEQAARNEKLERLRAAKGF